MRTSRLKVHAHRAWTILCLLCVWSLGGNQNIGKYKNGYTPIFYYHMMRTYLLLLAFVANYCFAQNWALKYTIDNEPFHEGLAAFYDGGDGHLHGFMNTSGEIVIPAKYKYVDNFNAGTAVVTTTEGKKGIIDKHDHFILQPIYKYISPVDKVPGMYEVTSDEDRHGLFYNGRLVLPVEYKSIDTWLYPFIEYQSQDDIRQNLNLIIGDIFDNWLIPILC